MYLCNITADVPVIVLIILHCDENVNRISVKLEIIHSFINFEGAEVVWKKSIISTKLIWNFFQVQNVYIFPPV